MNIQIISTLSAAAFIEEHNLNQDVLNKHITNEAIRLMDKYTPMESGDLKEPQATSEGAYYRQPYANYQHEGGVMGPNVLIPGVGWRSMAPKGGKHYTGESLTYHGAPTRGDHWEERMMADQGDELERDTAKFVTGGG